jgi:hypothetical protein
MHRLSIAYIHIALSLESTLGRLPLYLGGLEYATCSPAVYIPGISVALSPKPILSICIKQGLNPESTRLTCEKATAEISGISYNAAVKVYLVYVELLSI